MRLSAYATRHGVDAFTFDDFLFVGSKVAQDPSRLILVGGQAIETWGSVLDVPSPTGDSHPLTEDADWLGGKRDAQWLCGLLGKEDTELQLADPLDPGVNTALAYHRRPDGRVVLMDFLRAIVGPSNEEVRALAVPLKIAGITLSVLHPLLCLESRLANLRVLESKRKGNGPLQAEWAISIVTAYLRRLVAQGVTERQVTRACHRVASIAEQQDGKYCFLDFGIDALVSVPGDVVQSIGGRFASDDWPRTVSRVEEKRKRWRANIEIRRQQASAKAIRQDAYTIAYTPKDEGV